MRAVSAALSERRCFAGIFREECAAVLRNLFSCLASDRAQNTSEFFRNLFSRAAQSNKDAGP
jgi:hypothetical protein